MHTVIIDPARPEHHILSPELTRRLNRYMRLDELWCRRCRCFHGRLADFGICSIAQWQAELRREAKCLFEQPAVREARLAVRHEFLDGVEAVRRKGEPFPVYLTLSYANQYHRTELDAISARLHDPLVVKNAIGLQRSFITTRDQAWWAISSCPPPDRSVIADAADPDLCCLSLLVRCGRVECTSLFRRADGNLDWVHCDADADSEPQAA